MTPDAPLSIGLIGLGRMGRAMAARLTEQGAPPTVWNRTPGRAQGLAGATEALSPADLAHRVDTVLVVVRDEQAMRDVYSGDGGLASADLAGKTVVEMSTASIPAVRAALAAAAAAGAKVIDAPISGSVEPARRGELLIMAGGDAADLQRVRPALDLVARRVAHMGPLGAGITMKLVVNLPLAAYWQTLGEALGLGLSQGLELERMLAVIGDSKAAIGALPSKRSRILDPTLDAEFDLAGVLKDLHAMRDSAQASGLDTPGVTAALNTASAAVAAGLGGRDLAQLVRFAAGLSDRPEGDDA